MNNPSKQNPFIQQSIKNIYKFIIIFVFYLSFKSDVLPSGGLLGGSIFSLVLLYIIFTYNKTYILKELPQLKISKPDYSNKLIRYTGALLFISSIYIFLYIIKIYIKRFYFIDIEKVPHFIVDISLKSSIAIIICIIINSIFLYEIGGKNK